MTMSTKCRELLGEKCKRQMNVVCMACQCKKCIGKELFKFEAVDLVLIHIFLYNLIMIVYRLF